MLISLINVLYIKSKLLCTVLYLEDKKMAKRSKKFALLSNSVGTFGNKLKKKSPAEKEGAKKSKSVAKRKFSAPRIDVKPGGKRIDKNLRRFAFIYVFS